ncbi:hypothetical protein P7K49_016535 [Saguinus oedipus]|uniref:STE20-related kinase adapter protein alpha n=1 Tax=Saguinus oedipus TaxID=9490 RepID=A0ABQ9VCB3_SAGOE|nr:hypothetical protein P7K49_016535 [Saguinus oedipus]
MSFLVNKPGQIRTKEVISESIASFSNQEIMSSFLPEGWCYELLTVVGKGFEDLTTLNLARYKLTGEYMTARRINLETCSGEMVTLLQGKLHISRLFKHPNIVPYRATFIADNEVWVVTSLMVYGSAKHLIWVLKALDYVHHIRYVHRSVKTSHILISVDGKVYLSGLRSNLSMISHQQWQQIKRCASEALPELLCPVTPITRFEGSQSQDHSGIFGRVANLEELEVDDWEFRASANCALSSQERRGLPEALPEGWPHSHLPGQIE